MTSSSSISCYFLALTLSQRQHNCGFLCFVIWDHQATASDDNLSPAWDDGKSGTVDIFSYNINLLGWHATFKGWYTKNEKRRYSNNRNLGIALMNSYSTCTNFNIPLANATCIEIDKSWKSFTKACKNLSTSPNEWWYQTHVH